MNVLQTKVLTYLLAELEERSSRETCDEGEVPGLSTEERTTLTRMLYEDWQELDEWDGEAHEEFGTSSLCALALSWLKKEEHIEG